MTPAFLQLRAVHGYLCLGMIPEARRELCGLEEYFREAWPLLFMWMCVLAAEGDWEDAKTAGRCLIEEQPDEPRWRVAFAEVVRSAAADRQSLDDRAESLAILQDAEAQFPADALVKYTLARWMSQADGMTTQAEEYLRAAFTLDPALRHEARNDAELETLWPLLPEL